ncbi:hypothetical protein SCHPADRAFT_766579 [Schizopora paradoxa]|uniref:Uncharacterized protein n=1 Tax=Schizopora paradoxa TaxID=27342 RepID=A0A0H2RFU1_9AGAM|nr:hypothetical protein SCHPADRAFT_766579 [Schizopora paradoxa]
MPLDLSARDVFVPKILYPHAGTVWKAGNHHNVTWDTSDAPVNITNIQGMVVFAKNGLMFTNQTGGLDDPLASGFSILLGRIEIQVPEVAAGDDYQVVLFGDSGNFSPKFTITN